MKKIIDVSKWQGAIDWPRVKASGIDGAILRAGYGNTARQADSCFEANYAGAKAAGLYVGAYWYSYATSEAEAVLEARACLTVIRGKKFEYPVWFDQEYEPGILALTNAKRTAIVRAFCSTLEAAGYYSGVYASANFINTRLDYKALADLDCWAAQYGPACGSKLKYGMWQYTSSGIVPGVNGRVDMDYVYKDYPAIIKGAGLNGYTKAGTETGTGDGGEPARKPEGGSNAPAAVTLATLQLGPISPGDLLAVQRLAKELGLGCREVG